MTEEIKFTPPTHIVLTLFDDRPIVCPVNYCIFRGATIKGSYVLFNDKEISVKESINEITAIINAPYNAAMIPEAHHPDEDLG